MNEIVVELNKPFYSKDRLKKGYIFESLGWYNLDFFNIKYTSNPKTYDEWKKHTRTNNDVLAFRFNGDPICAEFKFTSKCIRPSWLNRGWWNRGFDAYDCIVTNDKQHIPQVFKNWCRLYGKQIFNMSEFIEYLLGYSIDSLVNSNDPNTSLDVMYGVVGCLVSDSMTFNDIGHVNEAIPTIRLRYN